MARTIPDLCVLFADLTVMIRIGGPPSEAVLMEILRYCGFSEITVFFTWTSPALDGMHRVIIEARKTGKIQRPYDMLPDGQRPVL